MTLRTLQFGIPGGPELLIIGLILLLPIGVAYWTYRDAKKRGDEYAANWGISMFLFGMLGFLPMIVGLGLWFAVRPERPGGNN